MENKFENRMWFGGQLSITYYTDEPFYYINIPFLFTDPHIIISRN